MSGYEIKRQEDGWIFFDRNGYLLKDSRRKRRGVQIAFTFTEIGGGSGVAVLSSSMKRPSQVKAGSNKPSPDKKSPVRTSTVRTSGAGPLRSQTLPSNLSSSVPSSAPRVQPRKSVERTPYKAEHVDMRQFQSAPQSRLTNDTESFGVFPEKFDVIKQGVKKELNSRCEEITAQSKNQVSQLDRNVAGFVEDSRQISSTLDKIEQERQQNIKSMRATTLDTLDSLLNKSEGLSRLQDAHDNLTAKQHELMRKEHQLTNLKNGNTLLDAILSRGTDLNKDREQLYSKFNEILTKDLEDQRAEVIKILRETDDEAKEVYKSAEIDRLLADIAQAIKNTALDEIRKRENQLDKNQRDFNRVADQRDDLLAKIKSADNNIAGLGTHIEKQKKEIENKETQLGQIREKIIKERQGLVQDENRNADLEKKLQDMKNRLRSFEQEKLYLLTEKNIANTKLNIEKQLLGERDKAMMEWMTDRIKDEKSKKAALEEKMNQCYSFETKDIIDLFKKEKVLQGEQRQDFINSLKEELKQKLENEKIIQGNVEVANAELKKIKKSAKKAPEIPQDHDVDHDKLYTELKEVTLDNIEKNQMLATHKKDVKEIEVKILLIQDDIGNLKTQCDELEAAINVPIKQYPVLEVDESELIRLRKELDSKKKLLSDLENQKAKLTQDISEQERIYKNIKIVTSHRFTIREEGAPEEEKRSTFASPAKKTEVFRQAELSPSEIRKSRLSQSPALTKDIENTMKEIYYGRQGPKIRKTDDGTFIYGTREFVVTKEKGKLYARDFEADDKDKIELEAYLKKYEQIERANALKTNLQFLNDDIGSEDEEMAEVGEEHGRIEKPRIH